MCCHWTQKDKPGFGLSEERNMQVNFNIRLKYCPTNNGARVASVFPWWSKLKDKKGQKKQTEVAILLLDI